MIAIVSSIGYSGKSLAEKLGVSPGATIHAIGAPSDYAALLGLIDGLRIVHGRPERSSFIHVFVRSREELAGAADLVGALEPGGILWVSWPKKSSKLASDVTEDTLREVFLPLGVVDVKVCAVDETWSGLKFLWRRKASGA